MFVLGEVDEMLSHEFKEQIYDIFPGVFAVSYSAFQRVWDDREVHEGPHSDSCQEGIVDSGGYAPILHECRMRGVETGHIDLYKIFTITQAVIFINMKKGCLTENMHAQDFTISAMYGDMDQRNKL